MLRERLNTPTNDIEFVIAEQKNSKKENRVSPSTVVAVMRGTHPQAFPGSKLGIEEHQRIAQMILFEDTEVIVGYPVPESPIEIPQGELYFEKLLKAKVSENLTLSARPDVRIGDNAIIEIKPRSSDYHIIQTIITCLTTAEARQSFPVDGILHYYKVRQTWAIPEGAPDVWPLGYQMCELANEVKIVQDIIDKQKEKRKGMRNTHFELFHGNPDDLFPEAMFVELNNHAVAKRNKFIDLVNEVLPIVKNRMARIY